MKPLAYLTRRKGVSKTTLRALCARREVHTFAAVVLSGTAMGGRVDATDKKDLATDFINLVRNMEPSALNALITKEAGEALAQFFLQYSANLIAKDPSRVLENTSSLMLMGYLIRTHEERHTPSPRVMQEYLLA